MTTATFDSHGFIKRMLGDGFTEQQAEGLAREEAHRREEEARQREADKAREEERDKELVTKGFLQTFVRGELSDLKFDLLKWGFALLLGFFVALNATNIGTLLAMFKLFLPVVP